MDLDDLFDCLGSGDAGEECLDSSPAGPDDCLTAEQQEAYREYNVQVSYITQENILQLPATDGDCVLVKTGGATQQKIITYWAERFDVPPVVPGANLFDSNSVLLDTQGPFMSVRPSDDDQRIIYRISGMYKYAQLKPVRGNYPGANSPVLGHGSNDIRLPASVFDDSLAATNGDPGNL